VFTEEEEKTGSGFTVFIMVTFCSTAAILVGNFIRGTYGAVSVGLGRPNPIKDRTALNADVAESFVSAVQKLSQLKQQQVEEAFREFGTFDREIITQFLGLVDHELLRGVAQTQGEKFRLTVRKGTMMFRLADKMVKPLRTLSVKRCITAEVSILGGALPAPLAGSGMAEMSNGSEGRTSVSRDASPARRTDGDASPQRGQGGLSPSRGSPGGHVELPPIEEEKARPAVDQKKQEDWEVNSTYSI